MPRKVKTTTVEENLLPDNPTPPANAGLIDPSQPAQWIEATPEEDALMNFLDGLGEGEVVIKIFKFDATTNRPRFMSDTSVEGANESFCQANWGEGRYMLKAYKEGKPVGSRTILVGPPLKKEPVQLPAPVNPGLDPALQIQMEMFRQEIAMQRDLMKSLIENMNKGDGKSSAEELAQIMVMLKGVIPSPTAGPSVLQVMGEAIPLVKQLIELGSNGGVTQEKGWIGLAKDLLPEVGGVLRTVMANRINPAPVSAAPTPAVAPYSDNGKAAPAAEIQGLTAQQLALIRQGISFLKTRARKNSDPDAFIGYVLETLDDEQSLAICSLLERSFDEFAVIDPEILQPVYRQWFEQFFGGLKSAIIERNASDGAGGDVGQSPENENPGIDGNAVRSKNP